jgi:arylformamidase
LSTYSQRSTTVIYDVTVPLDTRVPIFPGDPEFRLDRVASLADGAVCNLSRLDLGAHTGTHVDAPVHFIEGAPGVDEMPLEAMLGPAYVADATSVGGHIDAATFAELCIPPDVQRLIFKTPNSRLWASPTFAAHFVGVTEDAAAALVERGVRLVGIDYLSIAPPDDPTPTHVTLLRAGVVILEGVDLRSVPAGWYELACLPIRLAGADGAPARVILRTAHA